jgi:hypothetical protein
MYIPNQSTVVNVTHYMVYAIKSEVRMWGIEHGQEQTRYYLYK